MHKVAEIMQVISDTLPMPSVDTRRCVLFGDDEGGVSSSVGEGRVVVCGDSDLSSDSSGGGLVITSAEQ